MGKLSLENIELANSTIKYLTELGRKTLNYVIFEDFKKFKILNPTFIAHSTPVEGVVAPTRIRDEIIAPERRKGTVVSAILTSPVLAHSNQKETRFEVL